jgi:excisionase family DNA binding protein
VHNKYGPAVSDGSASRPVDDDGEDDGIPALTGGENAGRRNGRSKEGPVDAHHPTLLLTTEQAARELQVGRHTLFDLIARGELASVALGRRSDGTACQRRVERAELVRYIARLRGGEP